MSLRKPTIWVLTRSDTNQHVQSQTQARSLKFQMKEGLYYPYSENKGADQLRSYCEADLRLCFRLGKLLVFSCEGSHMSYLMDLHCLHLQLHLLEALLQDRIFEFFIFSSNVKKLEFLELFSLLTHEASAKPIHGGR